MEELTWTERREASFLNVLIEASWPQAPNDSTTRGMQLQPSSSQNYKWGSARENWAYVGTSIYDVRVPKKW